MGMHLRNYTCYMFHPIHTVVIRVGITLETESSWRSASTIKSIMENLGDNTIGNHYYTLTP